MIKPARTEHTNRFTGFGEVDPAVENTVELLQFEVHALQSLLNGLKLPKGFSVDRARILSTLYPLLKLSYEQQMNKRREVGLTPKCKIMVKRIATENGMDHKEFQSVVRALHSGILEECRP